MTPSVLFPRHSRTALGAIPFITGRTQLVGHLFTAVGTNAEPPGSCTETSTPTATTAAASTHASTGSRSLTSRACSISSRHFLYLPFTLRFYPLCCDFCTGHRKILLPPLFSETQQKSLLFTSLTNPDALPVLSIIASPLHTLWNPHQIPPRSVPEPWLW